MRLVNFFPMFILGLLLSAEMKTYRKKIQIHKDNLKQLIRLSLVDLKIFIRSNTSLKNTK